MNSSSETIKISGGGQANKTGNTLERFIERCLQDNGYTLFPNHRDQLFDNRKSVGGKQYSKQVPCGTSIYETKRKCDFLVLNKEKFPDGLIIECKWQQSNGSVDEKYPFSLYNIFKIGVPTIVLLDGGGYKQAAMKWLKDQVGSDRALIGVYNMAEFQAKVNNGFLG
jgi:hypothetical protein